jgi:hypothetical protein
MGVGDENVGDLEKFPGGEGIEISQVEEDRPSFKPERDIQSGIGKRVIYESGDEGAVHI